MNYSTAISWFLAFAFEIEVYLIEPVQFVSQFDYLSVLIIEAVFEFLVLVIGFIEGGVQTAFIKVVFYPIKSLIADIFCSAFAQIFLLQLL
jgi:hypothetical protein